MPKYGYIPKGLTLSEIETAFRQVYKLMSTPLLGDLPSITLEEFNTKISDTDVPGGGGNLTSQYAIVIVSATNGVMTESTTITTDANGNLLVSKNVIGKRAVVKKTDAYTATTSDDTIECDGTFTITLPALSGNAGVILNVVNIGTGVITVDGDGSETIMGETTQLLYENENLTFVANAAEDDWILR